MTEVLWSPSEDYVERANVTRFMRAHGLRSLGVTKGDTVAIFMPMAPETVAATMACAKVGAIYLPIFSGYGAQAVATRLQDAAATVLITADGFTRRGKVVPMKETAD